VGRTQLLHVLQDALLSLTCSTRVTTNSSCFVLVIMASWNKKDVKAFIELYHQKILIWNPQHPDHFNKIKRQDAWTEIANEIGRPVDQCKKKMENLLASLRREKMKMRKSVETGNRTQEIYKSNWFAFTSLQFLWKKNKPNPLLTTDITSEFNICDESAVKTESDEIDIEDELSEDCVDLDPPLEKRKKNNADPLNEEISLHSTHDVQLQQRMDEAFTILERDTQKEDKKRDECDIYAELVATKLRKMDERTRDIAMNKIDNLLFDLKINPPCQHQYTRPVHSCQNISAPSPSFCQTSSLSHRASSPHRQLPSP
jgi:hypothetical protein